MADNYPVDQALTYLNNSGIAQKQPALYQTIKALIDASRRIQISTNTLIATAAGQAVVNDQTEFLLGADVPESLPNARQLLAGTNITFDDTVANERTINASGSGDIPIHWAFKSNLTDAQFKALPSTYIELVAAPGAGKVLVPHWAYIQINAGTPYTNVDPSTLSGLSIAYGDWVEDCFVFTTGFSGASHRQFFTPAQAVPNAEQLLFPSYPPKAYVFLAENLPFKLIAWNDPGDYTGGNASNTFRIGVAYSIMDFDTGVFS